jgi:hypothetical protein
MTEGSYGAAKSAVTGYAALEAAEALGALGAEWGGTLGGPLGAIIGGAAGGALGGYLVSVYGDHAIDFVTEA